MCPRQGAPKSCDSRWKPFEESTRRIIHAGNPLKLVPVANWLGWDCVPVYSVGFRHSLVPDRICMRLVSPDDEGGIE